MADTAYKRATYGDLLDLPENLVGEILNGMLYTQPRPRPRHAISHTNLSSTLVGQFQDLGGRGSGLGGWIILIEPELHLGEDVLVPDIAGWRSESWKGVPDTAWFGDTPDWVCEILSPSTAQKDRAIKADIYLQAGCSHMWLLDPDARLLEAFSAEGGAWVRDGAVANDDLVALAPFAAAPFKLGHLWAD